MSLTIHIHYTGAGGSARRFAEEMTASGTADAIRHEPGNLGYDYYLPLEDPESVLLIDSWRDQAALDAHHASPMMARIAALRERYDLHMRVARFVSDEAVPSGESFLRRSAFPQRGKAGRTGSAAPMGTTV